jgi:nucleoside-diphosphate-sugar epimerase
MAAASLYVMELDASLYQANTGPMLSHINVGTGQDVTIAELARALAEVTGFNGRISFDSSRPDGAPRKLMDVSRLASMGWTASIPMHSGIASTYRWFLQNRQSLRAA